MEHKRNSTEGRKEIIERTHLLLLKEDIKDKKGDEKHLVAFQMKCLRWKLGMMEIAGYHQLWNMKVCENM